MKSVKRDEITIYEEFYVICPYCGSEEEVESRASVEKVECEMCGEIFEIVD